MAAGGGGGGAAAGRAYSFKVVLLGEGCVGKTSLVLRYCENKFNDKHITTLQVRRAPGRRRPLRGGLGGPGPPAVGSRVSACPVLSSVDCFPNSPWGHAGSQQPLDGRTRCWASRRQALKSPQGFPGGCACWESPPAASFSRLIRFRLGPRCPSLYSHGVSPFSFFRN